MYVGWYVHGSQGTGSELGHHDLQEWGLIGQGAREHQQCCVWRWLLRLPGTGIQEERLAG
jgi:hypothetical protein